MFHHLGLSGGPSPEAGRPLPPPHTLRAEATWTQVSPGMGSSCPSTPGTHTAGVGSLVQGPGPPLHPATGPTNYLWVQRRGRWSWSLPLLSSSGARPGISPPASGTTTVQWGDRTHLWRIFLPRVLGGEGGETVTTGTRPHQHHPAPRPVQPHPPGSHPGRPGAGGLPQPPMIQAVLTSSYVFPWRFPLKIQI